MPLRMCVKTLLTWTAPAALAIAMTCAGAASAHDGDEMEAASAPIPHAGDWTMLEAFCTDCHNFEEWAGGVAFDTMSPDDIGYDAEVWEEVVRRMRGRLMPPPGNAQPDQTAINSFVAWMESELDGHADSHEAGHVPIHRLNRIEYAVAVKGLLDVDVEPEAVLPTEVEIEGFANIAQALGTSPAFLDQYLSAARQVARLAVGDPEGKMANVTYNDLPGQNSYVPGMPLGTRGGIRFEHNFPADGEYRFNILDVDAGLYPRAFELETTLFVLIDDVEVFRTQLGGPDDLALINRAGAEARAAIQDRVSDIPAYVTAGKHTVTVTFLDRSRPASDDATGGNFGGLRAPRLIDGVTVVGPYDSPGISQTASREKIFICMPEAASEERACAEQIARDLARRAYRRPVTDEDVAKLMPFYETARGNGGGFDAGVEQIVTAVLASPDFLYRTVTPSADQADQPRFALDDLELATRLSFFLWSQNPDAELLDVAASGDLSDPAVLDAQVTRMLNDPRAQALVENFALAWLNLDELDSVDPDRSRYPGFSDSLRDAFATEIRMFLSSILLEDRSVLDILGADHTFVNEQLARHYDIEGVYGPQFREITLENPARFGVLGKGAFQLRTSYGDRTSPVLRGAWVLERLMGTPPTPPPPGVETDLTQHDGERPVTLRARLEQHRADQNCNSCHGVIDPIGLALENFDVTGEWRDVDRFVGQPINASAVLPNGVAVNDVNGLRADLMSRPEQFVMAVTEKLMMYATGREVEYFDMPEVREIVRQTADDNYTFASLVHSVVASNAFRMQGQPEATAQSGEDEVQEASLGPGVAAR